MSKNAHSSKCMILRAFAETILNVAIAYEKSVACYSTVEHQAIKLDDPPLLNAVVSITH